MVSGIISPERFVICFKRGSAELLESSHSKIRSLAKLVSGRIELRSCPLGAPAPPFLDRFTLGFVRARKVVRILESQGVDPRRISIETAITSNEEFEIILEGKISMVLSKAG